MVVLSSDIKISRVIDSLKFGARYNNDLSKITFSVFSLHATRIELYLYAKPCEKPENRVEKMSIQLNKISNDGTWSVEIPVADIKNNGIDDAIYYGYRAWGPNWEYDAHWSKGTDFGFKCDVDESGNRFNPNKLLVDPYALELNCDHSVEPTELASGPNYRTLDSGPNAPKGIVLMPENTDYGVKPQRAFKDEIIYEVHLRGFTEKEDFLIDEQYRGTYKGAAMKAEYLKGLGITAVEFLPVQEFRNEQNDQCHGTSDDNYWGYETLGYFAPDRRYAYDKSAGGPTREFKEMVKAFHDQGIKVYMDVVYNHTGEGGLWGGNSDVANVLSWRGLDNSVYYELASDPRYYYDNTGVSANFNTANNTVRDFVIDSLKYWKDVMGVDGFRFDLAAVLGNACFKDGFYFDKFDPNNILNRAVNELPGVDLIAEPWAIGGGTFQLGEFPAGWAEWNGNYRDTIRKIQNRLGVESISPGVIARRLTGSSDLFRDGGDNRKPWNSVNFLVAHDGFTLRDLYSYNFKINYDPVGGSSDGGSDNNISWDQYGNPLLQRKAARTGLALLMLSSGVPMITGGDEMYRTLHGNNNPYNLDTAENWLGWEVLNNTCCARACGYTFANKMFYEYSRRLINFRNAHPELRPAEYLNGNEITWYQANGYMADGSYMDNPDNRFIAFRTGSIFVAYNYSDSRTDVKLPYNTQGKSWYRAGDTAVWMEKDNNFKDPGQEDRVNTDTYGMEDRSVLVLVEK